MRRRQGVHVEPFAGRGRTTVVLRPVPGGLPDFVIVRLFGRTIPTTADLIGPHGSRDDGCGIGHDRRTQRRVTPASETGAGRQGGKGGGDHYALQQSRHHDRTHSCSLKVIIAEEVSGLVNRVFGTMRPRVAARLRARAQFLKRAP
ncbi:hypothetical protein D3C72_1740020 [compost metagenome]